MIAKEGLIKYQKIDGAYNVPCIATSKEKLISKPAENTNAEN
jgi:hypothetical protein